MNNFLSKAIWAIVVLLASGTSCAAHPSLSISAEKLAAATVSLPATWEMEEVTTERRRQDLGASESYGRYWRPQSTRGSLELEVYWFESTSSAKQGYRRALELLRRPGFTAPPPTGVTYTSTFADQYRLFCGFPETTPGGCTAVARYVNYVVITGFLPDDEVTWEQLPTLFGTIDQHIQTVITQGTQ